GGCQDKSRQQHHGQRKRTDRRAKRVADQSWLCEGDLDGLRTSSLGLGDGCHGAEILFGLPLGYVWLEPRKDRTVVSVSIFQPGGALDVRLHHHRQPKVRYIKNLGASKALWRHTKHRVGLAVNSNRSAHD